MLCKMLFHLIRDGWDLLFLALCASGDKAHLIMKCINNFIIGCTHYISSNYVQTNKKRLENDVARHASEMEQLKKDWDKSEEKHKEAFKSIIVSEETLCDISCT